MKLRTLLALLLSIVAGLQTVKAQEAYAVLNGGTLTFYYDNQRSYREGTKYDMNTGDESPDWKEQASNVTSVIFNSSFTNARPTSTYGWFQDMENLTSIAGISYLNTSEVTTMGFMFQYCKNLTTLDVSHFDTRKVKNMTEMFYYCEKLTSLDVSNFNTSNVMSMKEMFRSCSGLTSLDVSGFNTSKVTHMSGMFCYCRSLSSINVSHFDTRNVTSMSMMFCGCNSLTSLDVSNFNTANVTDMNTMFSDCGGLIYLDLTNFNTKNVTDMGAMFEKCTNLAVLDLSSFNTINVIDMSWMFRNCYAMTTLDLCSFNTSNVTKVFNMFLDCYNLERIYVSNRWTNRKMRTTGSSDFMFIGCYKIVGGKGTTYDSNNITSSYAKIDGGPEDPGYLTYMYRYDFVANRIFYHILDDNSVEVTYRDEEYNNYSGDVSIPATVDYQGTTYDVTAIGESAFRNSTGLSGVTIPASVTEVGDYAFYGCSNLGTITCLAPTPPTAQSNTFSNYNSTLIVPSGSKSLYQAAPYWKNFTNIQEMKHYNFKSGGIYYLDIIGGNWEAAVTYEDTDYGTYSGNVEIPEEVMNPINEVYYTVTQIGERAFYRCPYLTSVTLPATINRIENEAFVDAFLDASNSTMTCLAKTPPTISPLAFDSGISLLTLYVRKGCKAAYEAHDVWKQFGNIVELPYHFQVKQIYYKITGENTVSVVNRDSNYYSYWSQNTIPATVNYEGVTYTVTKIDNVAFFNCPQLIRVIMPSTITEIGNRSFKDCTRLTSITLPENLQSIGVYAFDGCTALTDITCLATTPPSIDYTTFTESQYQDGNLYVPYGCYNLYWNAPNWEYFRNIIELPIDPDAINEVTETVKETPWYDLSGRKVTNPRKGIYIKNGKKVSIK